MALPAIAPYPMPAADRLPANRVDWTADPSRAALLIHDLQNYFLRPFGASPATDLLNNVTKLRERCASLGVPVFYSAQPGGQSPAERGLQQDFWGPGVPDDGQAAGFPDAVAPKDGDTVVTKWKYSAFVRTDLEERLRATGRDQLIIVGVYAHIGVLMTACDAWMRDIRSFIVADAVADFSEQDHLSALHWAAGRCAMVTTTDAVLDYRGAATLDPARIRTDVADVLGEPAETIADDDDLMDLGLDSIRLMTLLERWRRDGAHTSFEELAERPTLLAWQALLESGRAEQPVR